MEISARRLLTAAALAAAVAAAPAAAATTDHSATLTPTAPDATFTSKPGSGFNTSYFLDGTAPGQKGTCGKDPNTMCESTLVHVVATKVSAGTLTLRLEGFQPYSDFDLRTYASDAEGTPDGKSISPTGDVTKTSPLGSLDPRATSAGDYETTTVDLAGLVDEAGNLDGYFLVQVPYFMVANDSYTLKAELSGLTPFEAPAE